jgi:hypothetical protein
MQRDLLHQRAFTADRMEGFSHRGAEKLLGRCGRTADFGLQRVEKTRHVFPSWDGRIPDLPQPVIRWNPLIGIKEEDAGR